MSITILAAILGSAVATLGFRPGMKCVSLPQPRAQLDGDLVCSIDDGQKFDRPHNRRRCLH